MKIDITYEKADLLKLVEKDLKARGIKSRGSVEYKGALQIKLTVDVEEAAAAPITVETKEVTPAPSPEEGTPPSHSEEEGKNDELPPANLDDVLKASRRLNEGGGGKFGQWATQKPQVPRQLAENESFDYPRDKPKG